MQLHGLRPDGKTCTCRDGEACGKSAAKHPVEKEWQKAPAPTPEQIAKAWSGWRSGHNIGIATGADSGIFVLDVDPDKGGRASLQKLQAEHGDITASYAVQTGSGGWHLYFALPPDFIPTNSPGRLAKDYPGLDVRGEGGQVVAPSSVTPRGPYVVLSNARPQQAPPWLLDMIRPQAPTTAAVTASDVPTVSDLPEAEGERLARYAESVRQTELARVARLAETGWTGEPWNQTTYNVACTLLELVNSPWNGYTIEAAKADLFAKAPRDSQGFNDERVQRIWDSALSKVGNKARPVPQARQVDTYADFFDSPDIRTDPAVKATVENVRPSMWKMRTWDDLGNAGRMVDHYGGTLRWVEQVEKWAVYADGRWMLQGKTLAQALTQKMISSLPDTEALLYSTTVDDHEPKGTSPRDRFLAFVSKQRMTARITAAMTEARAQPALQAELADFDAQSLLFNATNGVVNLETGELLAHDPKLMLMQKSPVVYDPTAACSRWQKFLDRVMPDPLMQQYLQRVVGYSITGKISEQAMFLHHGSGANGKSVFLQVCTHITGDYGQVVPRETLLVKQGGIEHPTSVARMAGRRFLQVSETAAGKRLDEEIVKGLTGGEKQTARYMGKDFFDFEPTGKIHYVTNHLPRLTDAESIWRRLHLIGWRVAIPAKERDGDLANRIIREEAAGVLAWAVRGAAAWLEQGLTPPDAATLDLRAYRADQDIFGEFLREHCRSAPDVRTPTRTLYDAYSGWAFRSGIKKPMTIQAFSAVLKERGYEHWRTGMGSGFTGLVVYHSLTAAS